MFPRCTLPFSSLLLMKVSTGLRTAVLIIPYAAGNRKHLRKFRWFFCRRVYVIHSAHTSSLFTWLPFWLPSSPNFGSQPHSNGKNPSVFIIKNPIKNPRKPYTSGDFLLYARQESNLWPSESEKTAVSARPLSFLLPDAVQSFENQGFQSELYSLASRCVVSRFRSFYALQLAEN